MAAGIAHFMAESLLRMWQMAEKVDHNNVFVFGEDTKTEHKVCTFLSQRQEYDRALTASTYYVLQSRYGTARLSRRQETWKKIRKSSHSRCAPADVFLLLTRWQVSHATVLAIRMTLTSLEPYCAVFTLLYLPLSYTMFTFVMRTFKLI